MGIKNKIPMALPKMALLLFYSFLTLIVASEERVQYSAAPRKTPLVAPASHYFVLLAEDAAVVEPLLIAAEQHASSAAAVVVLR